MQIVADIGTNLLGNIAFWLLLGSVSYLALKVGQARLRAFFGITPGRRLTVCLSNAWQDKGHSRRGYLIAHHELWASQALARLFGSSSFRLPDMVRGLVDSLWVKQTEMNSNVSPPANADVAEYRNLGDNLIVLGGSARNTVRKKYVDEEQVVLALEAEYDPEAQDRRTIVVKKGDSKGRKVNPRYPTAIVEKVIDGTSGATIFFCHGARADMTWAAAEYLVRNWRDLRREFGDHRPFAICLSFPGAPDSKDYLEVYTHPARMTI